MGNYIKRDKDLSKDPRLLECAGRVAACFEPPKLSAAAPPEAHAAGFSESDARNAWRDALLGGLDDLWAYADVWINSDNTLPLSVTGLAQVMGLPGWMVRMYPHDWLLILEDGSVELPDYVQKNNIKAARDERKENRDLKREQGAARQQKHRDKKKAERNAIDKESRERYGRVTPALHGASHVTPLRSSNADTGTGTRTLIPRPGPAETSPRDRPSSAPPVSLARDTKDLARPAGSQVGNGKAAEPVALLESRLAKARQLLAANPGVTDVALKITCGLNGTQVAELRAAQSEPLE